MALTAFAQARGKRGRLLRKLEKIMRITTFLLLAAAMHVSAATYSQSVSLDLDKAPLIKALDEIRAQTGFAFFGDAHLLSNAPTVTVHLKRATIIEALDLCLAGMSIRYEIHDKLVLFHKKEIAAAVEPPPAMMTVSGRVVNDKGEPLVGISITVKGTTAGTTTNASGDFELQVADAKAILVVSGANIETMEVKAKAKLIITATVKVNKLDEIQIVAYGKSSQRYNVGSVYTVKSEDIQKAPVSNVLQALVGRVPGVIITQNTGYAGSAMTVTIEGQNSIRKGNNPFYVIDGVPYMSTMPKMLGSILGESGINNSGAGGFGNPLNYINPADIESITVLKDADATAIYGSRAANGAILITTKKGKAGPVRVDLNLRNGRSFTQRRIDVLNRAQFLDMRREALRNDGLQISTWDWDLNGTWDTTRSVNWEKELLGNRAGFTEGTLNVSGGSANSMYFIGGTYQRQTTLAPFPYLRDRRGSLHFSQNISSTDARFKMDLSFSYMYDNNILPQSDNSVFSFLSPVTPDLYKADGTLNWAVDANGNATWSNPLTVYLATQTIVGKNLTSSLNLSYQLIKGLTLSAHLGYNDFNADEKILFPLTISAPQDLVFAQRRSQFSRSSSSLLNVEPQLFFTRSIGAGQLDLTAGASYTQSVDRNTNVSGSGYTSDQAMEDIASATAIRQNQSSYNLYRLNGGFGRISYVHAKRYMLNLTGRRDGTSRFGSDNLFHDFGSVGAGWIFSEEPFFNRLGRIVSFGKINASYGTTGSDQVGNYAYMDLYYPVVPERPFQGGLTLVPSQLTNTKLQWELNKKFNAALSLGFLKQQLTLDVDYYQNESGNQLLGRDLPAVTGFGGITVNRAATVRNYGYNMLLATGSIKLGPIFWVGRISLSVARNKLVRYDRLEESPDANNLILGKSLRFDRVVPYVGVDPETGLYTFRDHTGKVTSNPDYNTDRTKILDLNETFYGNTEHTFTFKGVSLSMLWQFVKKKGSASVGGAGMPGQMYYNQPVSVLNRWQKPGDRAAVQRFSTGNADVSNAFNWYMMSDANYQDASFARLKNVTISWRLPAQWCRSARLRDAELYGNAQNLMTITRFPKGDPETLDYTIMPNFRTVVFGVRVGI